MRVKKMPDISRRIVATF